MTIDQLVYDIINRLTGFKPSDDTEYDYRQVKFWIDTQRASLVPKYVRTNGMASMSRSMKKEVLQPQSRTVDGETEYYLTLSSQQMNFDEHQGIFKVTRPTIDGKQVEITNIGQRRGIVDHLRFGGCQEYFEVGDGELILNGGNYTGSLNLTVTYIEEISTVVPPGEIISEIQRLAEEIGLPKNTPQDVTNDGLS